MPTAPGSVTPPPGLPSATPSGSRSPSPNRSRRTSRTRRRSRTATSPSPASWHPPPHRSSRVLTPSRPRPARAWPRRRAPPCWSASRHCSQAGRRDATEERAMSDPIAEPMPPAELQPAARRDPWARLTGGFSGFAAVGLLVLAAALGGLIAGGFAFTLATARVATVLLLAMLVVNGTSGVAKGLISRRRGGRPRLVVRPIHIVLLVVIALFTQWIGIGAVVLFGLLMVVPDPSEAADPSEPATDDRRLGAVAVAIGAGWALVLGVAAAVGTAFIAGHPFTDLIIWEQIDANRAPQL